MPLLRDVMVRNMSYLCLRFCSGRSCITNRYEQKRSNTGNTQPTILSRLFVDQRQVEDGVGSNIGRTALTHVNDLAADCHIAIVVGNFDPYGVRALITTEILMAGL